MIIHDFDVDIDVPSTFDPTQVFAGSIRAARYEKKKLLPHPCGVYFQDVPIDPLSGLAAVPFEVATQLGCFKVDFLHLHVYDHFSSKEEIRQLMHIEPDWTLLEIPSVIRQLFHLSKHAELVVQVKPRSVIEVADCLALIRPKRVYLQKYYLQNREKVRRESLYVIIKGDHSFKKAHAVAYAYVVVLQLHLIKAGFKFEVDHE